MNPTDRAARIAGAWYLAFAAAPFSILYVPRVLIVAGDATATAGRILARETLFRLGIVGELLTAIVFIFVVRALYRLLGGVNKAHASLMVTLALVSVPISFVNVLFNFAALALFRGADVLGVFDKPQRDALGMLFLGLHREGIVVSTLFWGLWLFPFGALVMKSGFLPRILGALLIVNGLGYVVPGLTALLLPGYAHAVSLACLPALLGELWIVLWLLMRGASAQRLAPAGP